MTDEQKQPYDMKTFYFKNLERRDADLIQLRDSVYKGDIDKMLATYEDRLKHPNANESKIKDDIDRLKHIRGLESQLAELKLNFDGVLLTSLSPLVRKYESERKSGNGHGLAMLL